VFFFNFFFYKKLVLRGQNCFAKLRGRFCSFFLGGQNRNFVKVRRRKLLLSLDKTMNLRGYIGLGFQEILKDFLMLKKTCDIQLRLFGT